LADEAVESPLLEESLAEIKHFLPMNLSKPSAEHRALWPPSQGADYY
jgi:hypothetical protein